MLKSLHLNGQPAINYFDDLQFGTGSKKGHIRSAMKNLPDEIELKHVVLFDDELRNKDVETIGVQFAHIFDEDRGLTKQIFQNALKKYNDRLPTDLTTGNDIVIKTPKTRRSSSHSTQKSHKASRAAVTPKWVPVSQDSGALITEELSLANSPITPRESIQKTKKIKQRKPVTPKQNIIEEYEPRISQNVSKNLNVKTKSQSKPKPKLKKVVDKQDSKLKPKPKPKTKTKPIKKEPILKPQKSKTKVFDRASNYNEEIEDEDEDEDFYENYENRFQANLPNDESQDEDLDDTYSLGSKEIKISRLPTSTARLTSLDLVLQSLNESLENETESHFKNFQNLNKSYFNKTLDLNLTNNNHINKLKDIKFEKQQLRKDLFDTRQEINENLRNLEKIRLKYNQTKQKIKTKKKINDSLNNLPNKDSLNTNDSILIKLNNLNNIIDPNYGLLEKLKQLNSKFYEVEES
ncbi:Telomere length regulator protein [Wickerhamomyces ciferrii]|uniref:Telomere length regulator protein n=1 Tax=Wickerhamomyces ciferrii (strain ATCC 14091 / BCRC 22168 / CBS 111 / JCM 3599 / NBRC 0793 / NRRL Y-1031 F-60-10) TaxID=1206466 RepID=K0KQ07_WICCF|nr:Telomere length regulator protein [Wickerhamomyces ciferrii]CCH45121.1 Telomere length regulator protein [Wickerhamomyces ciferrii]